jgi:hypothetical protein
MWHTPHIFYVRFRDGIFTGWGLSDPAKGSRQIKEIRNIESKKTCEEENLENLSIDRMIRHLEM